MCIKVCAVDPKQESFFSLLEHSHVKAITI